MTATNHHVVKFTYDYSVDGGAVGTVNLRGPRDVPSGSIVSRVIYALRTQFADGGAGTAQIKVGLESSNDLMANNLLSGAHVNESSANVTDYFPLVYTATTPPTILTASTAPIVTTQKRVPVMTIAAHALTAGKLDIFVEFFV